MQHLQHKKRQMKHLKHASKTLEKHLKTIANIRNIQIKHFNIYVKRMQYPNKHTCNNTSENIDETL